MRAKFSYIELATTCTPSQKKLFQLFF